MTEENKRPIRSGDPGWWAAQKPNSDGYISTTYVPVTEDDFEPVAKCPVCREFIDYCQGHGESGDPTGHAILKAHDEGDHSLCAIRCES